MFKELRLKLTIINLSIMLALFSLLIIGTYHFSQVAIAKHSQNIIHKIAEDVQSGAITDLWPHRFPPPRPESESEPPPRPEPMFPGPPPGPGMGPNFFFVKTTPDGTISFASSSHYLATEQLAALTKETSQLDSSEGKLIFNEINYSFYKVPLQDQPGLIIIFQDLTHDSNILYAQTMTLLIVGLICCLLSFGASFFMANRAMIPIQKAWKQQKDFLSDASHELRTPLAIIQTNLDIVRGNPEETVGSQSKWLDNIQEESSALAQLVDALFFLARADSNQQPLNKQLFSLSTALHQATAPFETLAASKGVTLQTMIDSPIEMYGDEARLKQAMAILLDNAIRHTDSGGSVAVSLQSTIAKILLTVTDTGEGIDPIHLDKIFNRFYQADNSRHKGGAGLGLSIAKWIVERHDGLILVTSTPKVGTTFTIKLPACE